MRAVVLFLMICALGLSGCHHTVKTEPIEINANITVDVRLRVDRELDDLFRDLDEESETLTAPEPEPATTDS